MQTNLQKYTKNQNGKITLLWSTGFSRLCEAGHPCMGLCGSFEIED